MEQVEKMLDEAIIEPSFADLLKEIEEKIKDD